MEIKETLNSTDSFNNPFDEINANVIDTKRIVEYWCNPFSLGLLTDADENRFRTSKMPIILQGSRGSGKTTILKYFSFPAQVERAILNNKQSVLKLIEKEKEVGFYFRCEESFIGTFISVFQQAIPERWTKVFECYLELILSQKILDMVLNLIEKKEIFELSAESICAIVTQSGNVFPETCTTVFELNNLISKALVYIEQFKNRVIFTHESFNPVLCPDIFSISIAIVKELKKHIQGFRNTQFLFMIDEYENLNEDLQKRFNTIIKFVKPEISIRVGIRREELFTTETVNDVEYLRNNHDYFLASIGKEGNKQAIRKYFYEIANMRFRMANPQLADNDKWDIINILGDNENLDQECKEICKGQKLHLEYILKQSKSLLLNDAVRQEIIRIIRNDDNPIAETINALWVIRSKADPIAAAKHAADAMKAFFCDEKHDDVKKYKEDYSNKYRYAITVYICSVYKKEKQYYGFNALCHLSSGNVRTFINFCQSIINDALFYDKSSFLKAGRVSNEIQSRAIKHYSRSELEDTCSVVYAGDKIKRLILNLGNCFSAYHKDRKIRYPETTQCAFDVSELYEDEKRIIRTAESWSILVQRQKVQRTSAGVEEKTELYHINKMFAPLFNISYRTRGGVNLILSASEVHDLLNHDSYLPQSVKKLIAGQDISVSEKKDNIEKQLSIFDMRLTNE